jgi:3-methylcrotonyl-CoA carboxylase alpha subunit
MSGPEREPEIEWRGETQGFIVLGGRREPFSAATSGETVWVRWRGRTYRLEPASRARRRAQGLAGEGREARAPMPGIVLAVRVKPGDAVAAGQALVTLEAMKMEHAVRAAAAGRVARVPAAEGSRVEAGALLVELEPDAAAAPAAEREEAP